MEFKELCVFNRYKDICIGNAEMFRGFINKKFKGLDARAIYTSIVNYQVKKYGRTLDYKTEGVRKLVR